MRQAGRYLPEYRALREDAGDFLTLCYTPELACEVTLQPIRRFGMDAAIIFSDILVVPHGLGRDLSFVKGQGPWLEPLETEEDVSALNQDAMIEFLQPVYEALRITRQELPDDTALIGFAGAPWTLLCYMLDGNGKQDFINARSAIYKTPGLVAALIETLTEAVTAHLIAQIEAGAQAVQLFDSWASHVPAGKREALVFAPAKRIVEAIRAAHPDVPVIGFPRAIGAADMMRYAEMVIPDGLSVDMYTDMGILARRIPESIVLQGNLDPLALVHDMAYVRAEVKRLKEVMADRPFVFNLGHGVLPSTPPSHMKELVECIREE